MQKEDGHMKRTNGDKRSASWHKTKKPHIMENWGHLIFPFIQWFSATMLELLANLFAHASCFELWNQNRGAVSTNFWS